MKTELLTPRPVPSRLLPVGSAAAAILLALPLFLVAGWPVKGWALGAILWAGLEGLSFAIARIRARTPGTVSSGLQGVELVFKALAVLAVVLAAAHSDASVAVAAILVYALAYTLGLMLSVASYFGAE